jgi:hypothetical protein
MNVREEKMAEKKIGHSFLTARWWLIHLIGISLVYTAGNLIWR